MFYSETLLSKTGPLARVWLSANIERKLSKNHVLQTNVKDSVDAIVTPNQAPLALRLSGQLLLGVVRIYRRKANYLLDDCNEALLRIKMAFRSSGNHDMAEGSHMPSRDALMLPDVLTEGDDLEMPPLPDAALLLSRVEDDPNTRKKRAGSRDINLHEDFSASQFLQNSIDNDDEILEPADEIDLGLDLGFDVDVSSKNDISYQVGRDAPEPRKVEDDLLSKIDDTLTPSKEAPGADERESSLNIITNDDIRMSYNNDIQLPYDDDIRMPDQDGDIEMTLGDNRDISLPAAPVIYPERISESPLSDIEDLNEVEGEPKAKTPEDFNTNIHGTEEEISKQSVTRRPAFKARRQRQLQPDSVTELSSAQIKSQQTNTEKIVRPRLFLPYDPRLLSLSQMQKTGGFVSQAIGSAQCDNWAIELRGILSLETVQNLKRKRNTEGLVDNGDRLTSPSRPRLDLGEEESEPLVRNTDTYLENIGNETSNSPAAGEISTVDLAIRDNEDTTFDFQQDTVNIGDEAEEINMLAADYEPSPAPQVDPIESVPISSCAEHAVHILRNHFKSEVTDNSESNKGNSVLLEDLQPESLASRTDVTKFFFEILVLGTKDAISIEQEEINLGGPIRISPKHGLWSAWAEQEAGEEQDLPTTQCVIQQE